jgi:hypothetical protein
LNIFFPPPDCQFELSGADGIVRSSQVEQEEKTKPGQAVDCIWTIKATPKAKVLSLYIDSLQRRTLKGVISIMYCLIHVNICDSLSSFVSFTVLGTYEDYSVFVVK